MPRIFWKRALVAATVAAAVLAGAAFTYRHSAHVYQNEIANIVHKAVDLVDNGNFVYEGNATFFWTFSLGPLAHLLTAVPLLFSRDIHWLYGFNIALVFLSAPLFYAACRRLGLAELSAALGAGCFVIPSLFYTVPILPDNTSYLPFFLALYAYVLAGALREQDVLIIPLWATVGLCMQLNISAALLIPATLAAMRAKTRMSAVRHLAGLAIVAAMHFHLVFQAIDGLRESTPFAPIYVDVSAAPFHAYLGMLRDWSRAFLEFRISLYFLALAVAVGGRRVLHELRRSPVSSAALGFYLTALLCMPLVALKQGAFHSRYNLPSLVYWAMLSALAFDAAFADGRRLWTKRAAALIAFAVQIPLLGSLETRRSEPTQGLESQLAIAERATRIVREEKLIHAEVTGEYAELCRYRHPEMKLNFQYPPYGPKLWVCRRRRGERVAPRADAGLAVGAQLVDQFDTPDVGVQIYLLRAPPAARSATACDDLP